MCTADSGSDDCFWTNPYEGKCWQYNHKATDIRRWKICNSRSIACSQGAHVAQCIGEERCNALVGPCWSCQAYTSSISCLLSSVGSRCNAAMAAFLQTGHVDSRALALLIMAPDFRKMIAPSSARHMYGGESTKALLVIISQADRLRARQMRFGAKALLVMQMANTSARHMSHKGMMCMGPTDACQADGSMSDQRKSNTRGGIQMCQYWLESTWPWSPKCARSSWPLRSAEEKTSS